MLRTDTNLNSVTKIIQFKTDSAYFILFLFLLVFCIFFVLCSKILWAVRTIFISLLLEKHNRQQTIHLRIETRQENTRHCITIWMHKKCDASAKQSKCVESREWSGEKCEKMSRKNARHALENSFFIKKFQNIQMSITEFSRQVKKKKRENDKDTWILSILCNSSSKSSSRLSVV